MKKSCISNIVYAFKKIWKWDKAFCFYYLPIIPLAILLPLAAAYSPKLVINAVEAQQSIFEITIIIGIYFASLFLIQILNAFCDSRIKMRDYNFSAMYQYEIIGKFMHTDFSNTDHPEKNIKYSLAMDDACSGSCAPELIWSSVINLIINLFGIFTYGSIVAALSPVILVLLLISALITYLISRWQRNYIEKHKEKWTELHRKIGYLSGLSSKFEYAKDVRIYHMLGWLGGLLTVLHKEQFIWTKKVSIRSLWGRCISAFFTLIRDGAAYAVLIISLYDGKIDAGDFVFYFGVVVGFSGWLNGIAGLVNDIVSKSIKIGYYRDYFALEDHYNHGIGCRLPDVSELPVEIEFCGVSYQYPSAEGGFYALKDINLTIHKGEKLAVVGTNGAGKTTLVKLLCGFYYPTDGEIRLNGRPVTDYNIENYYTLFSAVFQDIYLLPVTIAEFVSSSDSAIDRERVKEVLRRAGLESKIESLPNGIDSRLMKGVFEDSIALSGGETQKLMLARALYKDAPVIVLDEPTAAMDPIAENELYLQYHSLTQNKTSVYISHRLSSTQFCDRIIFMENGKIIETGSHEELIKLGGKYANMFALQGHYYKKESDEHDKEEAANA